MAITEKFTIKCLKWNLLKMIQASCKKIKWMIFYENVFNWVFRNKLYLLKPIIAPAVTNSFIMYETYIVSRGREWIVSKFEWNTLNSLSYSFCIQFELHLPGSLPWIFSNQIANGIFFTINHWKKLFAIWAKWHSN